MMLQVAKEAVRVHTTGPMHLPHQVGRVTVWDLLNGATSILTDQETSGKRRDRRYPKMLNLNLRMMTSHALQEAALLKGTLTRRRAP